MTVRVKICGLRTAADVDACLSAGADAVGFNFYPKSKRYVTPAAAASLARAAQGLTRVGVFVGAPPNEVAQVRSEVALEFAQLHGGEDPAAFAGDAVQVIRVKDRASIPQAPSPRARWVLLDAFVDGFGGAGHSFDWTWVAEATQSWRVPVLIAGGLTPDNVADAVRIARPWGVDVASGVESAPGVKDAGRIRAFIEAVRAASGVRQ